MKEWWKDYFSFTKKERTGAIVLSILIIAIFIAPQFFQEYYGRPDEEELNLIRNKIALAKPASNDSSNEDDHEQYTAPEKYNIEPATPGKLFNFDPNTLSVEGWRELGVNEKVIQTIRHYIDKGGKFRRPEDLKRVYGLRPAQADHLIPYVVIKNTQVNYNYHGKDTQFGKNNFPVRSTEYREFRKISIDINLADTSAWIALPGIGSKLAIRIVNFRDKLGGFYAIEQVGETFGLADSVFQKIRSHLQISDIKMKQIDINKASLDELKQHPYIRWNIAQAIVRYREQHGPFTTIEDLSQINIIDDDLLSKIKPYVILN